MNRSDSARRAIKIRVGIASLRAANAYRILSEGHSYAYAAEQAGYKSGKTAKQAIARYLSEIAKSPVPVGAGSGADQINQQQNSTKEEGCQC